MAALRTSLVKRRHAYTSADIPWSMDVDTSKDGEAARISPNRWRLFRYLAGGGMRAFGRPSVHALQLRRQERFLWIAGVLAVFWLVFSFV